MQTAHGVSSAATSGDSIRANVIAVTATVVGVLPMFLVGGLSVFVREELVFGLGALGLLVSVYFATSALFSSPAGVLVERFGFKRSLTASVSTSGLVLVSIGWLAGAWSHLFILLAVAGLANATTQVASNLMVARTVVSHRQGLSYGVKQSAIPIATLITGASVGTIAAGLGWRVVLLLAGLTSLVVIGGVLTLQETRTSGRRARPRLHRQATRALITLAVAGALASGVANTLGTFLVESLVHSMSRDQAGLVLAVGSLSGIIARVGSGWIVDHVRFKPLLLALAQLVTAVGGYLLLSVADSQPVAMVAAVVTFATGWGWTGVLTYAAARKYPWAPARATGITQAGIYAGAVIGPTVFGVVMEEASHGTAWVIAAGVVAVAAVVLAIGSRQMDRAPGHIDEEEEKA